MNDHPLIATLVKKFGKDTKVTVEDFGEVLFNGGDYTGNRATFGEGDQQFSVTVFEGGVSVDGIHNIHGRTPTFATTVLHQRVHDVTDGFLVGTWGAVI